MKKEPFRLTLTHYGTTITIEVDHSDVPIDEAVEMCKQLLIAAGYHPDNVNQYING